MFTVNYLKDPKSCHRQQFLHSEYKVWEILIRVPGKYFLNTWDSYGSDYKTASSGMWHHAAWHIGTNDSFQFLTAAFSGLILGLYATWYMHVWTFQKDVLSPLLGSLNMDAKWWEERSVSAILGSGWISGLSELWKVGLVTSLWEWIPATHYPLLTLYKGHSQAHHSHLFTCHSWNSLPLVCY